MVSEMDRVMQLAYSPPSFRSQIEVFVALQPDGVMIAEEAGRVIGTGCCIAYPDAGFGWVGLIATEPSQERRGIGRSITEHAMDVLRVHRCAAAPYASVGRGPLFRPVGFYGP